MKKLPVCIVMASVACALSGARAANIVNPQNLNLLEYYGDYTGTSARILTQTSASENASLIRQTFDGGMDLWGNASVNSYIRYTLPQAMTVDKFYIYWGTYSSHYAKAFTIKYSDTVSFSDPGWSSVPQVQETNTTTTPYTSASVNTPVKYVELSLQAAGATGYMQVGEFMLLPPSSATIDSTGRNLLADPYTQQDNGVTGAGVVWSNALAPNNSPPNGSNPYWQLNFGTPKTFNVVTFSDYPGQYFTSLQVYVSNDGSTWGKPVWSGGAATDFQQAVFNTQTAQYIRVVPNANFGNSMNDIHVFFALPEPASLSLLALGGLALLRRRK